MALRGAGGVEHPARREDLDPVCRDRTAAGQVERGGRAAALGVHEQLGVGVCGGLRGQLGAVDARVDVALPRPDVHVLPTQGPADVRAEELVGQEQHLPLRRDRGHHLHGVAGRAADVGLGLHRCGRVDVADDDGPGVLGLPCAQLVDGDRVGERAAGAGVRDEHGLVRREDLGRLRHEVHTTEDDRRGRRLRGDPGQGQRVARVVGDVLDLGQLVVVRQQHRVALPCQFADLGEPGVADAVRPRSHVSHGHRAPPTGSPVFA